MILYCYDCGEENFSDRKFCKNCGVALSRTCNSCYFANQVDAKFCGGCGHEIATTDVAPKVEAQRRQLTIMFCDLVGSSNLAEKFDPEELRDLYHKFHSLVGEVIFKYEGFIAKYIGDGLLIYFGHPHAHEDDARRSILAGLDILEEINYLNVELFRAHKINFKVRIGIHTGLVVIGKMGVGQASEENAVVGEAPNIAARIQAITMPNTVAISHHTHDLTKGLFDTKNIEIKPLKGVSQAIKIYQVLCESSFLSDFDFRTQQGLTKMVGRTKELDFLEQSWKQVNRGQGIGQIVWLSGEAGVGKSRIINEFVSKVFSNPEDLRLYYCSAVHSSSAFFPIISHLKRLINYNKNLSNELSYEALKTFLANRALPLAQVAPLLAPLLGIESNETVGNTTPEKVKKMVIDSWIGLMKKMSQKTPLLLVFEDVHWVDPSTQELIDLLISQISSQRILLLITSRPHYHLSVPDNVSLQSLTLNRLDQISSAKMISDIGGIPTLPKDLIDELIIKTDGVPLFIEELTRTVLDSDLLNLTSNNTYQLSKPISKLAIPSSLKDSLMARLDQLSDTKSVIQVAATIGRTFSVELLEMLSLHSFEEIKDSIDTLTNAKLIVVSHESGSAQYQFSHALLHETAYQSLLKSTRKQYHGLIAEAIIKSFPHLVESEPEILAQHFTRAGKAELAAVYWLGAGKKANKTSSHHEAINHFNKGIELLQSLPESENRSTLEFQIQVRLIGPLIVAQGYASVAVEKAFTRALELSKLIGTSHEIFPVLHGRYAFYQVCGLVEKAESLVDEFYAIANHQKEAFDDLEFIGSRMRGSSLFLSGNSTKGESFLKRSIAAYDYERHKNLVTLYAQDIKVTSLSYLSLNQWHLGKISEARQCGGKALALAEQLASPNTTGIAYFVARIMPLALLDEHELVLEYCNQLITISKNQKMPLWQTTGTLFKGWALVRLGEHERGMKLLEKGYSSYLAMKIGLFRPCIMLLYAQACMQLNLVVKGVSILEASIKISKKSGEHWLDAEIHRYLGELLLAKPDPDRIRATEEFEIALVISRQQKSITQELRATMSLLRFSDVSDAIIKARTHVEKIIRQFDKEESFKDLCEAKELLEKGVS